ncbi:MAG: hypothetical protein U9O55_02220, partial [Patescibacteria group bacterium]|nr:hypothetical protein [Patescibacteria group bacterium]
TMILALVFSIIALVVIAAITLVLVIRIAALWILVILSPFAFLFSASPAGNKYASQWVQNFTKWVFTGPVLAFFIWLSFLTVKGTSNAIFHPEGNMLANEGISVGLASIGSAEVMGTFILAIVMLMASLIVAQQLGGMAASVAGGAYRSITSRGDRIVKGGFDKIRKTTVGAARAVPDAALSRMARSENVQGFLDRTSGSSSRFIRFSGTGALARKTLGSLRYKERQEEEQARRYVSKFDDNPHTIAKLANQRAFGARANMIKRVAQEKMPSSEMFASRRDNRPITQKTQNEAFRRLNDLGYQEFNNLTPNELFRLSNEGVFEKGDLSPQISGSLSTNSQTARADRGAIIRGLREYYARESGLDINDINIDETSGQLNVNGHLTGQRLWRSAANQADFGDQNVNNAYTRFMADVDSSQSKKESPSISKITGVNKLLRGEKRDNVRLALDFDQIDLKGAGANIKGKDKDKIKEKLFGLLKNQGYNEDELKNITEKIESSKSLQLINKGRGGQSARAVIAHEAMHSQLESVDQNKLRKVWEGIDNDKRKFIDDEIRKIWHNGKNMSENDVMHEYFADAMANTRKTWVREKGSQLDKETKNNLKDIGLRPGRLKEIEHSNEPKIQEKVRDYKKNQVQVEENRVADTIDTGNLEDSIKDLGNTFKDTGEKIKNSMSEVGKVDMFGGKTNYADQFKKDADSEIKYKTDKSIKEQSKNIKEFSSQIQQQDEPDKREKKNDVKKYNIKESNIEYNIKKIIKKNNQEKEENINEENNFQNDKE